MVSPQGIRKACPRQALGDYYSPFFRVKFFVSQGTLIDFAASERERASENRLAAVASELKSQPIFSSRDLVQEELNPRLQEELDSREIHKFASDLEITYVSAQAVKMTLTLTPPYEEAKYILDHRLISRGSLVVVEFGYTSPGDDDIISPPYLFQLTNPSAEFGDSISINLMGFDALSSNLLRKSTKRTWSRGKEVGESGGGGHFPTDLSIIEKLAKDLLLDVNSKRLPDNAALKKNRSQALEQSTTDWAFFKSVLSDNGATFFLCGKELIIQERNYVIITERPRYRFLYRSQVIHAFDVPISSASFESRADLFVGRKAKNITKVTTDRDTGVPNNKTVASGAAGASQGGNTYRGDTGNEKVTNSSAGALKTNKALEKDQTGTIVSGSNNDELLLGRVEALAEEGGWLSGLKGTITIPGVPSLLPQHKVVIDGLPDYYKGEYTVTGVVHKVGSSGYTSEVSVVRNGFITVLPGSFKPRTQTSEETKVSSPTEAPEVQDGR